MTDDEARKIAATMLVPIAGTPHFSTPTIAQVKAMFEPRNNLANANKTDKELLAEIKAWRQ